VLLRTLPFAGADAGAPLDLLCVAPHPDDAELGMGGTLALEAARGRRVGVLDLSAGEMATNGTPADRLQESAAAAEALGLVWRGNLGLPDRALEGPDREAALVGALRQLRPGLVFVPHPADVHPDHSAAARLCREALFSAGLRRAAGPAWAAGSGAFRPRAVLQYFINGWAEPTLVVDVSSVYETKRRAIAAHASQFSAPADAPARTRLNSGAVFAGVEARERYLGAQAGVEFAEGFVPTRPLLLAGMDALAGEGRR